MRQYQFNILKFNIAKLILNVHIIYLLLSICYVSWISSCTSSSMGDDELEYVFIPSEDLLEPNKDYIIMLGDIQEYTRIPDYTPYLISSLEWIKSRNDISKNILCVLQNGDVTNNNTEQQWQTAKDAFNIIDGSIPYIWCTGNHDYAWESGLQIFRRESSGINRYGENSLLNKAIVARFEDNKIDNIIIKTDLKKRVLNIISLEFGPGPDVLLWADNYVKNHPDELFILMTHEFLTSAGERISDGTSYAKLQFPNIPYSEPEDIWQELVWPNDNIICVLCGHNGFCKYLESTNHSGRIVPQILFNLQYQENGGNSMIQLWEIDSEKNEIKISVYNTIKQSIFKPTETQYSFFF